MKQFSLSLLVLIILSINIFAQDSKELRTLRKEINLSIDEIIRINKDIKFPTKKSLRVMLAINQSEYDKSKFEKWTTKWNKKNGKKYGSIELVGKAEEADVIVAQFKTVRPQYIAESKVKVGNISETGQTLSKTKVNSESGYRRLALPIRSYLLVRSNGFWTIIFREAETSLPEKQLVNPHTKIRSVFKKHLKKR